jgi:regulator of PEP synthase PpsR (kinase-PPPase family)
VIGGTILVISDATGETGEKVVKAALAQFFDHEKVRVHVVPNLRDEASLRAAVAQAKSQKALLVYTLVEPGLRSVVRRIAEELEVRAVDLLGNLLLQMGNHFGEDPQYVPGLGHELDAAYFKRVEAVEFAVNNDDGREPRNLRRADIVLVGVSRTSKTPLSSYIAHRGYRVANVPLVVGIPPPKELDEVDAGRVFGLVVDPSVLLEIRRTRMEHLGMDASSGYGDPRRVREELDWSREVFAKHPGWTVLDITGKAVEETAAAILERYRARFDPAPSDKAGTLPRPARRRGE